MSVAASTERKLTVLNPNVGFYVAHAWIWKRNPAGILKDWNPDVTCPPLDARLPVPGTPPASP